MLAEAHFDWTFWDHSRRPCWSEGNTSCMQRGHDAHVMCVSSDTSLNQRLPQIVLGNQHHLAKRVLAAIAADAKLTGSNLQIWCEQSSWVTVDVMLKFLHSLSVAVDALKCPHRTIVLVMDMAPPHLAAPVARAIRDRGWRGRSYCGRNHF